MKKVYISLIFFAESQDLNNQLELSIPDLKPNTEYEISFPQPTIVLPEAEYGKQIDWKMPSGEIYEKMCQRLDDKNIGGFTPLDGSYWTRKYDDGKAQVFNVSNMSSPSSSLVFSYDLDPVTNFNKVRPVLVLKYKDENKELYDAVELYQPYASGVSFHKTWGNDEAYEYQEEPSPYNTPEEGWTCIFIAALQDLSMGYTDTKTVGGVITAGSYYFTGTLGNSRYSHNGGGKATYKPIVNLNNLSGNLGASGVQPAKVKIRFGHQFRINKFGIGGGSRKKWWVAGQIDVRVNLDGVSTVNEAVQKFVDAINLGTEEGNLYSIDGTQTGLRTSDTNEEASHGQAFGVHIYNSGMGRFEASGVNISNSKFLSYVNNLWKVGSTWWAQGDRLTAENNGDGTFTINMKSSANNFNGGDNFGSHWFQQDNEIWGNNGQEIAGIFNTPGNPHEEINYGKIGSVTSFQDPLTTETGDGSVVTDIFVPIITGDQSKLQYFTPHYIDQNDNYFYNPLINSETGEVTDINSAGEDTNWWGDDYLWFQKLYESKITSENAKNWITHNAGSGSIDGRYSGSFARFVDYYYNSYMLLVHSLMEFWKEKFGTHNIAMLEGDPFRLDPFMFAPAFDRMIPPLWSTDGFIPKPRSYDITTSLEVSFGNEMHSPFEGDHMLLAANYNRTTDPKGLGRHLPYGKDSNKVLLLNESRRIHREENDGSEGYLDTNAGIGVGYAHFKHRGEYKTPIRIKTGPHYSEQKIYVRVIAFGAVDMLDYKDDIPGSSNKLNEERFRWRGKFYGLQVNEVIQREVETDEGGFEIKILGEKISNTNTHDIFNQSPVYGTALSNAYNGGKRRIIKNLQTGRSFVEPLIAGGYVCVGAYEDKPNNKIYYFVSEEGNSKKRDSIIEYDLMLDTTSTVYQDDNGSSSGKENVILNFSSSHLITGINKIDDLLYFTDNLNRPRKINVELAKKNEENISNPPYEFLDFIYDSQKTVFLGGDNDHPYNPGDYIYIQFNEHNESNYGFNGVAKVLGPVVKIPEGVTINVSNGSFVMDFQGNHELTEDQVGHLIGVRHPDEWHTRYVEIEEIVSPTRVYMSDDFTGTTGAGCFSLQFNGNNVSGLYTDAPWFKSGPSSPGKAFYADPKDAYSPLITFGDYEEKIKYFDVLKHSPVYRPKGELFKNQEVASNNLINNTFQFMYRYVHKDNEYTAYSPISDIVIDGAYASNTPISAADFNLLNNGIELTYKDTICDVSHIEIVCRKGNDGKFFLVDSVPNNFINHLKLLKTDLIDNGDADDKISIVVLPSVIHFYNNGTYPFIDQIDSGKLFDAVPILAKGQTILSNNRLAYGNIVEGYDNTDVALNVDFTTEGSATLEMEEQTVLWDAGQTPLDNDWRSGDTFQIKGNGSRPSGHFWIDCKNIDLQDDRSQFLELNWWMHFSYSKRKNKKFRYQRISFTLALDVTGVTENQDLATIVRDEINRGNYRGGMFGGYGKGTAGGFNSNFGWVTAELFGNDGTGVKVDFSSRNDNESSGMNKIHNERITWSSGSRQSAGVFRSGQVGVSSFKTGAHHNFGIAYFDETNRCSFVNVGKEHKEIAYRLDDTPINLNGGRGYVPFYSEPNGGSLGQSSKAVINIYNKAPEWAKSFQVYYTGNNTVDEFVQMSVVNCVGGTSSRGDDQIYLSLEALKGKAFSYNQVNNSKVEYNFVPGDRIRFISCVSGNTRRKFLDYIDLEIAGEELVTSDADSPIGNNTGYYIRINDPANNAIRIEGPEGSDEDDTVDLTTANLRSNPGTPGYNKLIVEIYRPKAITEDENLVFS